VGNRRILCALWGALLLATTPAGAAKHKTTAAPPVPAHNYVSYNLETWTPPQSTPGKFLTAIELIDSATATHHGDAVEYDTLRISTTVGQYFSGTTQVGPPQGTLVYDTTHHVVSCAWDTVRMAPYDAIPYAPGKLQFRPFASTLQDTQDSFLFPSAPQRMLITRLCNNEPLNAAKGFATIEAAIAVWKDALGAQRPPPPMLPPHYVPPSGSTPWADGGAPHHFIAVATDGANGNQLFLDTANIAREGQTATALTFAFLGPQTERFTFNNAAVAELRQVRYDCSARTITVVAEATWDRDEKFEGGMQIPEPARADGADSGIDAACGQAPADAPGFDSFAAAWHDARDHWPASQLEAWLPCLWEHLPADRRDAYIAQVTAMGWGNFILVTQQDVPVLKTACALPDIYSAFAFDRFRQYAAQRAALRHLAERRIDEAKILAAWRALRWDDRLHVIRSSQGEDGYRYFTGEFLDSFARSVGLRSSDDEGRSWLQSYVSHQAWIEGG
jgi:hypothetical protein